MVVYCHIQEPALQITPWRPQTIAGKNVWNHILNNPTFSHLLSLPSREYVCAFLKIIGLSKPIVALYFLVFCRWTKSCLRVNAFNCMPCWNGDSVKKCLCVCVGVCVSVFCLQSLWIIMLSRESTRKQGHQLKFLNEKRIIYHGTMWSTSSMFLRCQFAY